MAKELSIHAKAGLLNRKVKFVGKNYIDLENTTVEVSEKSIETINNFFESASKYKIDAEHMERVVLDALFVNDNVTENEFLIMKCVMRAFVKCPTALHTILELADYHEKINSAQPKL